ncbi:hypothetical protein H8E52_06945 [bacterium]|nr:hypothetical protein [bacterium]
MFRNWFIISLVAFMGLIGTMQIIPNTPIGTTPIALDGGENGDGEDGDGTGPGL